MVERKMLDLPVRRRQVGKKLGALVGGSGLLLLGQGK